MRAMVHIEQGNYAEAKKEANAISGSGRSAKAANPFIFFINGSIQLSEKNYQQARGIFSNLKEWEYIWFRDSITEPTLRDIARYGIGESYFREGAYQKAMREFQDMRLIHSGEGTDYIFDPFWPRKHYKIGRCYEALGDYAQAVKHYETFLNVWSEADEDIDEIVDAKNRIEKLKEKV